MEVLGSVEIVLSTERVRPLMTSLEAAWRDFTDPTENVKKKDGKREVRTRGIWAGIGARWTIKRKRKRR